MGWMNKTHVFANQGLAYCLCVVSGQWEVITWFELKTDKDKTDDPAETYGRRRASRGFLEGSSFTAFLTSW